MYLKLPYALTIAAFTLIAQAAYAGEIFPRIVVTVAPITPYVNAVLGNAGKAENLLRPGQDAHDFSMTLKQAEMLDKADIIIVPDMAMSPFLQRTLARKKNLRVIELTALKGAEPLPYAPSNPWLETMKANATVAGSRGKAKDAHTHDHEAHGHDAHDHDEHDAHASEVKAAPEVHDNHDHHAVATDPHIWLDPERMAAIALPLAQAISADYPALRPELTTNAQALRSHLLREVTPALRTMLAKPARTQSAVERPIIPFITYHAAYQYFLSRFGLAHYGEITTRPEETMGAKTSATLLSGAKTLHVRCLIGEHTGGLMGPIAKAAGARMVLLSPEQLAPTSNKDSKDWIKNDYDRFLYHSAKTFAECL